MALQHVNSRLFTRRDSMPLVQLITHGLTHDELTMQANAHDISRDPGKDAATKAQRANVFVETLLERGWPDGDEAFLDILSNVNEDRSWGDEVFDKARKALWNTLGSKSDLVFNEDGRWHLLPVAEDAEAHSESASATSGNPAQSWAPPSPTSTESDGAVNKRSDAPVVFDVVPRPSRNHDGPPRVFVVQGRDQKAAGQVRQFLRGVHLIPLSWEEVKKECGTNPNTFDIVRKGLEMAQIIVVVLSGDDEARLRRDLLEAGDGDHERNPTPQPRQNVLLEAGMALGMDPDRTVMVRTAKLREISDFSGIHWVTMKGTAPARQDFANELTKALKAAGVSEPLKHAPPMWDEEALGKFSISAP